MASRSTALIIGSFVVLLGLHARPADASSYGIVTEAVKTYSPRLTPHPCPSTYGPLHHTLDNATGFRTTMVAGGSFWVWNAFEESNVYDRSFYDPDITHNLYDDDQINFDPQSVGVGISFFSGHGVPAYWATSQYCTAASQCTNPGGGQSYPSFCYTAPGFTNAPSAGYCEYSTLQSAVTNSSADINCGEVQYGTGNVKLGESNYSGGWAGG